MTSKSAPPPSERVLRTPWGLVVLIDVDPAGGQLRTLPVAEQALAATFGAKRRATFSAGRRALRRALVLAGAVADDVVIDGIGWDDRGAPRLPAPLADVRVSITHKDTLAAAIVGRGADLGRLGIDLELDDGRGHRDVDRLAAQVLTPAERATLPDDDDARRREVFVRFSAKEALYKAIDPFVRRFVGFLEVTVSRDGDTLSFRTPEKDGPLCVAGRVVDAGDPTVVLTVVHASRLA